MAIKFTFKQFKKIYEQNYNKSLSEITFFKHNAQKLNSGLYSNK